MILLRDAQERLLALAQPAAPAMEGLVACAGRWLHAPLIALRTQPWCDISAMDGYALGSGNGPWRVVSEIPAQAKATRPLAADEAARIFTGAPVPVGADRILIQENAQIENGLLCATTSLPEPGRHIRRMGNDFAAGDMLAPAGTAITPQIIALAATAGHGALPVQPKINVGIIATGSELVVAGTSHDDPHALPSSNGPMLEALLAQLPCVSAQNRGIISDDLALLCGAINAFEAEQSAPSLLLLTGGASVGDHDLVRPALEACGWSISVHKVALKPGKPVMFAQKGAHVAIGLPGNPVSAYVTALLFALPYLRHLAGCPSPLPRTLHAALGAPLEAGGNREEYLRFRYDAAGAVVPLRQQDSGALRALCQADGLLRVPINAEPQDAGAVVEIITIA